MVMAYSADKHTLAPTPVLARFGWRLLASMRSGLSAPDAGKKPRELRVSQRAWKRNSALLMSLYQRDRP